MVNFFTLIFIASAMCMAAASTITPSGIEESILAPLIEPINQPLQAAANLFLKKTETRPLLAKKDLLPSLSRLLPTKTRKTPEAISSKTSSKRVRVHAYLTETLNAILPHTVTIRQLCARAKTPISDTEAEKLGWALVAELREMLRVLNNCLFQVKDCGNAPAPSGIPGGKIPTLNDICQLFFKILCEIKECCKMIGSLCNKYKSVRQICEDTLKQINSCMSSIAVTCGIEVGDLSSGLNRIFDGLPNFFADVDFDFGLFPSILAKGHGGLSLNLGLNLNL